MYTEFLARVIKIDAVQRHRAAAVADDERNAQFFDTGRLPGPFGDFKWSLNAPAAGDWGPLAPFTAEKPPPLSPAMQQAWDAAVAEWRKFIAELANRDMIASGIHPVSRIRTDIDQFEWSRPNLVLDVLNGDLIEGRYGRPHGMHTVLWWAIVVRAATPERKLGRIDWDEAWNEEVPRRDEGRLPISKKEYTAELEAHLKERYGVNNVDGADLRRF